MSVPASDDGELMRGFVPAIAIRELLLRTSQIRFSRRLRATL